MDIFEISQILSIGDASYLLQQLVEKKENISQIADKAGLTRKTVYKYLNNKVKNIKKNTKTQILGVSLLYNEEFTKNFIYNKLEFLMANVSYSFLEYLYEKIIKSSDFLDILKLYQKFKKLYQENYFFLNKHYHQEIIELEKDLRKEKLWEFRNKYFHGLETTDDDINEYPIDSSNRDQEAQKLEYISGKISYPPLKAY